MATKKSSVDKQIIYRLSQKAIRAIRASKGYKSHEKLSRMDYLAAKAIVKAEYLKLRRGER